MSHPARMMSVLALAMLGLAPPSLGAEVPTLAPDQLAPGQKAVVRTVFQGSRIEEFEAEIVGVLHAGPVQGDLILARATGPRVLETGIAQGMSGSPVYVDGRLVGALSSGWSFQREPLFGITPIGDMLRVLELPLQPEPGEALGPAGVEPVAAARFGAFHWAGAESAAATPAAPAAPGAPRPLALPLMASGLAPAALDVLARELAPHGLAVAPGGRAAGGGPPADSLVPGAAVAVDVMRGDLQLSAIGTVTWRDGDRVLIFGHPFFQAGEVRLPLSTAEIATIVSSSNISFKLGMRGREVGTAIQDRRPAVAGRIGAGPRLLPMTLDLAEPGRPARRFRFETIEDRTLLPTLAAVATLNALLEMGGASPAQSLRWTLSAHRPDGPDLVLSDIVAGDAPAAALVAAIASPLRFLTGNPYQRVRLDSLSVRVQVEHGREQWTVRTARLLDVAVRPGGEARLEVELERWRGARERHVVALRIPEEMPEGRVTLFVGGGAELSRFEAARLPGRYRVTSLDEAWRRLAQWRAGDALYVAAYAAAPEITREGRDYPELPGSAVTVLAPAQAAGEARRGEVAKLDERRLPLAGSVSGELQIPLTVDPRAR